MAFIVEAGPFSSSLRLYLSVDIVGSTAFKQAARDRHPSKNLPEDAEPSPAEPWFSPIAQFYRGIERAFSREWALCVERSNEISWPTGEAPELWKSIGDELIYTKLLGDHRETLTTLNAWISTVSSYRKTLKEQFKSLDLKSTAWVAGFPVHNAEVIFRSSMKGFRSEDDEDDEVYSNLALLNEYYSSPKDGALTRDYIGPAIDTGFRLAQLSTPRRLVISVELALLLIHAVRTRPHADKYEEPRFFYEGRHSFKGVLGGLPYPVFWIDMRPSRELEESEDKLHKREPLSTDLVHAFCQEFVKENGAYCFTPYILNNPDPAFREIPDHHQSRLAGLKAYWERETQKRLDEKNAGLAPAEPETAAQVEGEERLERLLRELDHMKGDPERP